MAERRTAKMAWEPQEEALKQLSGCLKDSLSGHNKNAQKQAEIVSFFANLDGVMQAKADSRCSSTDACASKVLS